MQKSGLSGSKQLIYDSRKAAIKQHDISGDDKYKSAQMQEMLKYCANLLRNAAIFADKKKKKYE